MLAPPPSQTFIPRPSTTHNAHPPHIAGPPLMAQHRQQQEQQQHHAALCSKPYQPAQPGTQGEWYHAKEHMARVAVRGMVREWPLDATSLQSIQVGHSWVCEHAMTSKMAQVAYSRHANLTMAVQADAWIKKVGRSRRISRRALCPRPCQQQQGPSSESHNSWQWFAIWV